MHDHKSGRKFMLEALKEAKKAYGRDEVPVGAVVVSGGRIIGRGHNLPISRRDPSAHAEMSALRGAAKKMNNYRLGGAVMYVTLEPCPMCAGALVNSRIREVVFGCRDARSGACGSVMNIADNAKLNHRVEVTGGVLEKECRELLRKFFREKREEKHG
jgi:tRNA(adenine34) deaminase